MIKTSKPRLVNHPQPPLLQLSTYKHSPATGVTITARDAGVHKSSLGLSTLRTQGLVNEPCTKMWKRCTRNWRKKCTRSQETPRSTACPRRCRACVLDEHLQPHPLALSNVMQRGTRGWRAKEWPLSDVEDDELAVLRS